MDCVTINGNGSKTFFPAVRDTLATTFLAAVQLVSVLFWLN